MFLSKRWSCLRANGLILALTLVSCSPAAAPSPTTPPAREPSAPAAAGPTAAPPVAAPTAPVAETKAASKNQAVSSKLAELHQQALASGQTKVTHYATFGVEADPLIDLFQRSFPGIQVERVQLRTPEMIQRLAAEAGIGRRIASVASAGATSMTTIEQGDHLLEWEGPANAADLPPVPLSQGKTRWPYSTNVFGMIVNTSLVPENKIPRTREDVLDPFWKGKGKMLVSDPRMGGTGLEYFTINYHQLGQEYLDRFKEQEPTWSREVGGTVAQQIARGEYSMYFPIGITSELLDMQAIAPVKVEWMRDGGSTAVELNVGVLKDAPATQAAKLWVSWLVSEDGQRGVVQYIQSHAALAHLPPPAGYPSIADINPQRRTDDQILRNNEYVEMFERFFFH
jgi:iron(III) transport system substrate-binding protein